MNRVLNLYYRLLDRYGRQNWWPAETPYEVVVGAILTQNTSWNNVEKALANLKDGGVLTPEKILRIEMQKLEELIRPAGFYRQKAIRLKKATEAFLTAQPYWDRMKLRKHFLSVNGIGFETADTITLYAFEKPIFVVDKYTQRFCSYFELFEGRRYEDYRKFFEENLPEDVNIYKEYHALIVAFGKELRKNGTVPL